MPRTTVEVRYPAQAGSVALRGSLAPLSWTESLAPARVENGRHVFEVEVPEGALLEFKPVRDGAWSCGRNYSVAAGDRAVVEPHFDRSHGELDLTLRSLRSPELGRDVSYRVFLPPSYLEHETKRFPVLYAQDGQSLFTPDPIDGASWQMDSALNELYELSAIEEVIVVAVHTDLDRLEMLSPVPDPKHGGGRGPDYLSFLTGTLKPEIDRTYRTEPTRKDTAVIGSSMGGLFSFFAAWTRPDVFGKAACLSSSFWWANRHMVETVATGGCPYPRPKLYIDSGAAKSSFEEDANLRDGYHDTRALQRALVSHCYVAGDDLTSFAFAGLRHDNASWAARLAIPLQVLFPRRA
jgi:predicted alpha/beta superfamily hydrolase